MLIYTTGIAAVGRRIDVNGEISCTCGSSVGDIRKLPEDDGNQEHAKGRDKHLSLAQRCAESDVVSRRKTDRHFMLVLHIQQLCHECSWTEICQRCHPPQITCFQPRICRFSASSPISTITTSSEDSSPRYSPSGPASPNLCALIQAHEGNSKRDGDPPEDAVDKKAANNLELAGRQDGHTFGDLRAAAKATDRLRKAKAWCITSFQRKTKKLEHRFGIKFRRGRMSKWGAHAYCDKEVKAMR